MKNTGTLPLAGVGPDPPGTPNHTPDAPMEPKAACRPDGSQRNRRYTGERVSRYAPRNQPGNLDRKSTRLNSSHSQISYAVFCLKKKKKTKIKELQKRQRKHDIVSMTE